MKKIDGQNLISIRTLKTWYDHDCVEVMDDKGKAYRLPVETIAQMFNEYEFVPVKKTKHIHLIEAILKGGDIS